MESNITAIATAIIFILSLVGNILKLPSVYQYEYIVSIIVCTILLAEKALFDFLCKERSNVASVYNAGSSGLAKNEYPQRHRTLTIPASIGKRSLIPQEGHGLMICMGKS